MSERALITFMGLCMGTMLMVAISMPFNGVTKSPKAVLDLSDAKMETATGTQYGAAKWGNGLTLLTVGSLSETFTTLKEHRREKETLAKLEAKNIPIQKNRHDT